MTTDPTSELATVDEPAVAAPSSRRRMLRLAGAAAVGAAAVAVAGTSQQARAADGDPMIVGQATSATTQTTLLGKFQSLNDSGSSGDFVTGFAGSIVGWDTSNNTTGIRAGVIGYSGPFLFGGGETPHGVLGIVRSNAGRGSGIYGKSESDVLGVSAGVHAQSDNGPAVQMVPVFAGRPATGSWSRGALVPDTGGGLWYCTAGGSPGTWVNLAAPQSLVGSYTAITPSRVYDSRAPQPSTGVLAAGGSRTLSIKDKRDLTTGAVTTADIVPPGAQAVTANVTVVNTSSAGFLAVNPGGTTAVSAATVNWFATGQILNNGVNLTIDPTTREVTVVAGGSTDASTDFVIDVTGYFL